MRKTEDHLGILPPAPAPQAPIAPWDLSLLGTRSHADRAKQVWKRLIELVVGTVVAGYSGLLLYTKKSNFI